MVSGKEKEKSFDSTDWYEASEESEAELQEREHADTLTGEVQARAGRKAQWHITSPP